jgi:hypothetical protein
MQPEVAAADSYVGGLSGNQQLFRVEYEFIVSFSFEEIPD